MHNNYVLECDKRKSVMGIKPIIKHETQEQPQGLFMNLCYYNFSSAFPILT